MVKFLVVVVSATGSETGWQAGRSSRKWATQQGEEAGAGGESVCGKALPFSLVGIGKQRDIERER